MSRQPKLTCQVIVGVEKPIFDALDALAATTSPPQSKSALCREAIYSMLRQYYPQAFNKSDNSQKIIPAG